MTELEKTKYQAINTLQNLCARCQAEVGHDCPVAKLIQEIKKLHGIPVIINSELRHVVFQ